MSKLKKRLNGAFVFVIFLFSCTRLAIARIWPFSPSSQKPPSVKVFALSEAAWLELRAGGDVASQDKSGSKSGDDKKEPPKSSEDKKEQAKSADCDKDKSGDDKKEPSKSADDKKKDASKSGECEAGPGGGDGDTGGSGG